MKIDGAILEKPMPSNPPADSSDEEYTAASSTGSGLTRHCLPIEQIKARAALFKQLFDGSAPLSDIEKANL